MELDVDLDWKKFATFALVLGVACAALLFAYYVQHPDASVFEAFNRRPSRVPPSPDVQAAMDAEKDARTHE